MAAPTMCLHVEIHCTCETIHGHAAFIGTMAYQDLPPPPAGLLDDAGLFLDFDGTLVELADRPDGVVVGDDLRVLLHRLAQRMGGRVAIVSGRSVEQIDGFLGQTIADYAVVGSHGAEIRPAGGTTLLPDRPASLTAAERAFKDRFGDDPRIVIEIKTLGVAIHYRGAPEVEQEAHALVDAFAQRDGLTMQAGKMMIELRMDGHDKGTAIATLCESAPFAGHAPIFVGDDLTDEPGMLVAAHHGGAGILIGPMRDTAATYRLDDVASFLGWLETNA
ncbi:trehalose-phosphatase [Sphingomonas lacusdianchii]|uniref:trehalose-phosphatase n=1 Tax=Sphingomonas lacusdianchii TaxID=2917992 RepID=UPI001F57AA1E|nr:trehalose-phosphatase [Sphingomonas sp. JXJ CY 53]